MWVDDMRTPLTYYGGKQALARQIVPLMPDHRVYLEPFAGGAAMLFAKPPCERETLNDLDGQIMGFWRVVRDRPEDLAEVLAATPYGRAEWKASNDPADEDLEAARRLLVNVDQSFSRSRRSWSVPCVGDGRGRWQPGSWVNLPPKVLIAAERLRGVALEHGDALDLIPKFDRPDAVLYVDPPYTGPLRLTRAQGYAVDDHDGTLWARLVPVLQQIEHAAVILSGYPCDEAEDLGWRMVPLKMKRTVQLREGEAKRDAPEVVWLSPAVPEMVPGLFDGLGVSA
jgi:DNA adenine methylase